MPSPFDYLKKIQGFKSPWESHTKLQDAGDQDTNYAMTPEFDSSLLVDDDGNVVPSIDGQFGAMARKSAGEKLIAGRKRKLWDDEYKSKYGGIGADLTKLNPGGSPMNYLNAPGMNFMNMDGFNGIKALQENAAKVQGRGFRFRPPLENLLMPGEDDRSDPKSVSGWSNNTLEEDANQQGPKGPAARQMARLAKGIKLRRF